MKNRLGRALCVYVVGNLLVWGISSAICNKMEGRDIFGRVKVKTQKCETKMDWRGNIILGTEDYSIV